MERVQGDYTSQRRAHKGSTGHIARLISTHESGLVDYARVISRPWARLGWRGRPS
jgi:hypothetical protein